MPDDRHDFLTIGDGLNIIRAVADVHAALVEIAKEINDERGSDSVLTLLTSASGAISKFIDSLEEKTSQHAKRS